MSTWDQISENSFAAAKALVASHARSAVSSAYYAVFSAITAQLPTSYHFPQGREAPSHERLPGCVGLIFGKHRKSKVKELEKRVRTLRNLRLQADYQPRVTIDFGTAREAIRHAAAIRNELRQVQ